MRSWCLDGRKEACHDNLASLTVGLRTLLAPAQFIATKQGKEAQTGPAEYLGKEAQTGPAEYLVTSAISGHSHQTSWHQITFWGYWAKAPVPQPLCIFKSAGDVQIVDNFCVGSPVEFLARFRLKNWMASI